MKYAYRQMTPRERTEVLAYRRSVKLPLHEPPHFGREDNLYLLTAANHEHKHIMRQESRRLEYEAKVLDLLAAIPSSELFAWCILPNHAHILARVDLKAFGQKIGRLHNGLSTQWNREDASPGRTVWHRFSDRGIRNESHFFATLNYIHFNPVKHGHVEAMDYWRTSSIHIYLDQYGKDNMNLLTQQYPALDYGKGWDW